MLDDGLTKLPIMNRVLSEPPHHKVGLHSSIPSTNGSDIYKSGLSRGASWGVPCNQLAEEEKSQILFTDDLVQYVGTTQEWTMTSSRALQPLLGAVPGGQW